MRAATRKYDHFASLKLDGFCIDLADEGSSFCDEMKHHSIASLRRKPPWPGHASAHQRQAIGPNYFQPTI